MKESIKKEKVQKGKKKKDKNQRAVTNTIDMNSVILAMAYM